MLWIAKEWSRTIISFIALPIIVTVVAVISEEPFLVMAVIFPFLFLATLLILEQNLDVKITATSDKNVASVGDEVAVRIKVTAEKGLGLVTMCLPIQENFEIIDGTNVHVMFKGLGRRTSQYTVKLRALRRGVFNFEAVKYTYLPAMDLLEKSDGRIDTGLKMVVLPKVKVVNRSQLRMNAKQFIPRQSVSRLGPHSTDFVAVRDYVVGDPYKFINWKSSARMPNQEKLMVNEYEREGARTVVFLLDRSQLMTIGTGENNPLESGASLVLSYSKALIEYGVNVGIWITPQIGKSPGYVLPGSGLEQLQRIKALLLLAEAYHADAGYTYDPLLLRIVKETHAVTILATNIEDRNLEDLGSFVSALRRIGADAMVIDIMPYGAITGFSGLQDGMLSAILQPSKKRYYAQLPRSIRIIPWDPQTENPGVPIMRSLSTIRAMTGNVR